MTIERLPSVLPPAPPRVTGSALGASARHDFEVVGAHRLSLEVSFPDEPLPREGEVLADVTVRVITSFESISLGRCRLEAPAAVEASAWDGAPSSASAPRRRGRLVPIEGPINCRELFRSGRHVPITEAFEQLPLLFARKEVIDPGFRSYTSDLVYDFRVYRSLFDDIDVGLAHESEATRADVERVVIEGPGQRFMRFFDEQLAALEKLVAPFTRQDHERHGFYFRRQLWDVILSSPFLERTNIRPRGYAGDWVMMQYIYRNEYLGRSLSGKLLHKHSMNAPAAQAVRNRRQFITETILAARLERDESHGPRSRLRFLSVACGPATEVEDLFVTAEDCDAYECALLDQDEEALGEAVRVVAAIKQRTGRPVRARFIRQSVRTVLRKDRFAEEVGRHHLVYSMGLFDYLTAPVARAVLHKLYELLEPGGQMIVGNYHIANPTRIYMEYWVDWTLIYRTEEELLALAQDLPGASCSVTFEETGCQMFLTVRKAAR